MANWQKIQKSLPSKKFTIIIGSCIVLVLLVFCITSFFGSKSTFAEKNTTNDTNSTIDELMTRDSNDNGIPDWQESLYGLDPTANGAANAKIIQTKQDAARELNPDAPAPSSDPTGQFAQSLLSTILAMQQSGTLTTDSLTGVAQAVGDSVDAKQNIPDAYTSSDINVVLDNPAAAKATYESELKALIAQYASVNFGSELTIISQGLQDNGQDALQQLAPIASAYLDFSQKLITLDTPKDAAPYVLALANASAHMSDGLTKTEVLYTDVITGMVGINEYTTASQASDSATQSLSDYFFGTPATTASTQ